MARFAAKMEKAAADATLGLGALFNAAAGTPQRAAIYDLVFGSAASPAADNVFLLAIKRSTTAPTGTTVTPAALDPAIGSGKLAALIAKENLTVNGTLTANTTLLEAAVNQRGTFRWAAAPGSEIWIPAVLNEGVHVLTPVATAAVKINGTIYFEEQ